MKKSYLSKRLLAFLMAMCLAVSLAACGDRNTPAEEESSSEVSSSDTELVNPLPEESSSEAETEPQPVKPDTELLEKINNAYNINNDVVGWLTVPNTTIDEAVMQYTDNEYYLRRDINKTDGVKEGCYFADYACTFGDRTKLSENTIIYGHNLGKMEMGYEDDPNGIKFAQLHKFADIEFAKANPNFYFSTPEDNMTFEVFCVMYTDHWLEYIYPQMDDAEYTDLLKELKDRSIYDYDVDVTTDDKIMTLSTCTYKFGAYGTEHYAWSRFVVVGRLLRPGEEAPETATLTANADAKPPQFPR